MRISKSTMIPSFIGISIEQAIKCSIITVIMMAVFAHGVTSVLFIYLELITGSLLEQYKLVGSR